MSMSIREAIVLGADSVGAFLSLSLPSIMVDGKERKQAAKVRIPGTPRTYEQALVQLARVQSVKWSLPPILHQNGGKLAISASMSGQRAAALAAFVLDLEAPMTRELYARHLAALGFKEESAALLAEVQADEEPAKS